MHWSKNCTESSALIQVCTGSPAQIQVLSYYTGSPLPALELQVILNTDPWITPDPQHWSKSFTGFPALIHELHRIPSSDPWITSDPQHWSMNYTGTPAFASRTERDYQHWYFWFLWVELNSLLSQLWHPLRNLRNSTGSTLNNLAGRQLRSRNIIHTVSFCWLLYSAYLIYLFIHLFIFPVYSVTGSLYSNYDRKKSLLCVRLIIRRTWVSTLQYRIYMWYCLLDIW